MKNFHDTRVDQNFLSYNFHIWETFVIQIHTIPYVQKIVWKLYDKNFSMYENCMIGVFP